MRSPVKHKPVKPLGSLFGALPDLDMQKIYEEHNREVEIEDEEERKLLFSQQDE